jgi:phage repressor protein C with HTH and peptisase S24 domain
MTESYVLTRNDVFPSRKRSKNRQSPAEDVATVASRFPDARTNDAEQLSRCALSSSSISGLIRNYPAASTGKFRIAPIIDLPDISGMSTKNTFKQRVEARLTSLGINAYEAARRGEFEKTFVEDIISEKKMSVRGQNLLMLAKALECDAAYLLGAQGEPRRSLVDSFDPDSPEPVQPEAAVNADGHHGIARGEIPQVEATIGLGSRSDAEYFEIPSVGGSVAAVRVIDTWKVPEGVLRRRFRGAMSALHIVECEGDSMEPKIHNGDFVFIDTSRRLPSPPGIFAINDGMSQTLKRVELIPNSQPPRVMIISENDRHPTFERGLDEVNIVGRYLCRLTME